MKVFLTAIVILACSMNLNAKILINEVCSGNGGSFYDDINKTPDWIELRNDSDEAVSLAGWKIYDSDKIDKAFVLPDTIMPPNSYLVVVADDRNDVSSGNTLIKSSGAGVLHNSVSEGFNYYYLPAIDDFFLYVNVRAIKPMHPFDHIGLMFREDLKDNSVYYGVFARSKALFNYLFLNRNKVGDHSEYFESEYSLNYPDTYLFIQRKGDTLYYGINDSTGYPIEYRKVYYPSNIELYGGIAIASCKTYQTMQAVLGKIVLNGEQKDLQNFTFKTIGEFPPIQILENREIHSNFKISSNGETIHLWRADGALEDKLTFGKIGVDMSYGYTKESNSELKYFDLPSPGMPNTDGFLEKVKEPEFVGKAGFFETPQTITITNNDEGSQIYYTTDGRFVDKSTAQLYDGKGITIGKTSTVKARAYKDGHLPSDEIRMTMFINDSLRLPILYVSTDSLNIFGDFKGIFNDLHLYEKIEAPIYFEYWDNQDKASYSAVAGMQVTGSTGKFRPQKPFRLYARDKYDYEEFDFNFFDSPKPMAYQKLWLRTASSDLNSSLIRDYLMNEIMMNSPSLAPPKAKPCVVYINGDYHGIYYLKEYIDEEFLETKYKISENSVNLLENSGFAKNGSPKAYDDMVNYLKSLDMKNENAFAQISEVIDVNNLIDYLAIEMYSANEDWAINNIKYWQSDEKDKRWRWIMHDLDVSFFYGNGPAQNTFDKLYMDGSRIGELMRILFKNEEFVIKYLNRHADLINSNFKTENLKSKIDSIANIIRSELQRHRLRWSQEDIDWEFEIAMLKEFATYRKDFYFLHNCQEFGLDGVYYLSIKNEQSDISHIKLNSLVITDSLWGGLYFKNIPIEMSAIADNGYVFASWGNENFPDQSNISFSSENSLSFAPFFVSSESIEPIVINEIMYKPTDEQDSKDWVELFNPNDIAIDVSSWTIKDDKETNFFVIPDGTSIPAQGYLVLAEDASSFTTVYPDVENFIGSFDFGLSASGDQVRLYDRDNVLVDSVAFKSSSPWDEGANGTGASLELIFFGLDNLAPESWKASTVSLGTPGKVNSVHVSVGSENIFNDVVVYPNPSSEVIYLEIPKGNNLNGTISIFDLLGNLVYSSGYTYLNSRLVVDVSEYTSGAYQLVVETGGVRKVKLINIIH